ncbi:MAG: SCO family protein [Ardenticatenaceae bacterium]|nr:SCO family protein [Ardenticatenaceae bacterium]
MTTVTEPTETKPKPPGYGRTILLWIGAAILIAAIYFGWRLAQGLPLVGTPQMHGFLMNEPATIGNFTLTSVTGGSVSLSDYRDKIVIVYFGYTHCPDVCPATMLHLANARASLKPKYQDDVQVLMVTVDPARDTPELLAEYLGHFDPTFVGLTGTEEEIAAAAAPLGIYYEKVVLEGVEGYFMDHTATAALLDRDGRLRLIWPFGVSAEDMAVDLNYFVRE